MHSKRQEQDECAEEVDDHDKLVKDGLGADSRRHSKESSRKVARRMLELAYIQQQEKVAGRAAHTLRS